MKRLFGRALLTAAALLGLILILSVTALLVVRSGWFREQIRQRIIAEAEKTTGGRIELGGFEFDWHSLTAQLIDFVIHGTEPPGSPPLLRVRTIVIRLKILSFVERKVDLRSVDVHAPAAHLIIYPDGATNIPEPKVPNASRKSPVATILDLAIGRFTIQDGAFQVNSQRMPWSSAGENLRARFVYNRLTPDYRGDISADPLHLRVSKDLPVDMRVRASLRLARNKLTISSARVETAQSDAELSGAVEDFAAPQVRLQYTLRMSLDELVRTLRFHTRPEGVVRITGSASIRDFGHYWFAGNLHTGSLALGPRNLRLRDVRAESPFRVDPEKIELTALHLSLLGGEWKGHARIEKLDQLSAEGAARNLKVGRVAELFGVRHLPWDGLLSGPAEITGLVSDLNEGRFKARAQLSISSSPRSAPVDGFVDAAYDGYRGAVDFGRSFLQLPSTRLDFTGVVGGQLHVHLASTNLTELLAPLAMISRNVPRSLPVTLEKGEATFEGTLTGPLVSPQIAGHATVRNLAYAGERIDSMAADLRVSPSGLSIHNGSVDRAALHAQFTATVGLHDWKPESDSSLSATGSLGGAGIHELLVLAGAEELPAEGIFSASAEITGSLGAPSVRGDLTLAHGSFYGEPFDSLTTHVDYANNRITVSNAHLHAAAGRLSFDAAYTHAVNDLGNGNLTFEGASERVLLNHIRFAGQPQFSLAGSVRLSANGSAAISRTGLGKPELRLTDLRADVEGQGIQFDQRSIGAVRLTARTEGPLLTAHLESAIANSAIRGDGKWNLAEDYAGTVQFAFKKLDLASLETWLARGTRSAKVAGSLEGTLAISGSVLKPETWTAGLNLPELEISPVAGGIALGDLHRVTLRNRGPVHLTMQNSVVRVASAELVGRDADLTVSGTISLKRKDPLDLRLKGNIDLALMKDFNADMVSSGKLIADATLRGRLAQPVVSGRLEVHNASFNLSSFPNGLSNANGVILFSGDRATIQNLTAQSGGGKVTLTGFASYVGTQADFRIELDAQRVRLRYPEGVSNVANAKLNWTGTSQRNLVSGTVTILRVGFNPRTDFASMLAGSAEPVRTPAASAGLVGGMNFDIQIETAPNLLIQSTLAQQIQAEASLRLRGTATNPAVLGRINITQGSITFFGNEYTINQGSISFLNPIKIEPIVDIDLQTRTRGIDVTLTFTGPMNKLNVTYRSDPPLQFSEIVALLATGSVPTSNPSLAVRQAGAFQSWQQAGPSALATQALSNPASGRLQRFFAVSKIKIDPFLTDVNNPQSRLTIEQQVTPDVTFTYITNVAQANPQVVRVEWAVNRRWSVVAVRDENGLFGLDFYYRKRLK